MCLSMHIYNVFSTAAAWCRYRTWVPSTGTRLLVITRMCTAQTPPGPTGRPDLYSTGIVIGTQVTGTGVTGGYLGSGLYKVVSQNVAQNTFCTVLYLTIILNALS